MFSHATSVFKGKVDVVFANAGVAAPGFPHRRAGPPNITSIQVNLVGVVYTM
ncbi:hypothetical protein FB45DRAFT_1035219 [Roridomyces roridus]|uniref:Uncharacterized protein n=1 Tax=Roridomyces roridus TaxID=1738132 RepID=A0AAD7FFS8_9AGAR|nr:hypothetical protein FB45DRAFT_1035219 [Roridomyces roridus]